MVSMFQLQLMGSIFIFLLIGFTSALRGPRTVHGLIGRSLSVTCHYDQGYRSYYKYWCKGANWHSCTEVVKTRGLEAEVKDGRTSIKDSHTCSCFTVTLEDLREADIGEYWCAIEKRGTDLHTQVIVAPGFTSALSSPGTVHGLIGRSLSVTCHYDRGYQSYYKYWCKGANWGSCTEVVKTRGSEAEVKDGRTSIKDNHVCSCFTVTLEDLREADGGEYWCAIKKTGADLGTRVTVVPDSSSGLTGPKAVSAVTGSSVSVVCCYDERYQGNRKHWCRRVNERNCVPVISTTGSEQTVIKNRVSIRDNHSLNNFTVTMDNLSSSDSGIYSCAVRRAGGLDLMTPVNVTVLSTPQMTDVSDNQDHGCSFQKSESNTTSYQMYVPFLVSICLKLPIFLTLVLAIIWMHRRNRQHSDEATAPERQP